MNSEAIVNLARAVIETEAAAVGKLSERLDQGFLDACRFMLACKGRIVVIGVGKNQGIKGDSSLIVKRGGARIANLNIVEVKPNVTVADIRQKSLSGVVQPGDQVIFQNLGE